MRGILFASMFLIAGFSFSGCTSNTSSDTVDAECANIVFQSYVSSHGLYEFPEHVMTQCCMPAQVPKAVCEKFIVGYLKAKAEEQKKLGY
jgi:hypothetical protein